MIVLAGAGCTLNRGVLKTPIYSVQIRHHTLNYALLLRNKTLNVAGVVISVSHLSCVESGGLASVLEMRKREELRMVLILVTSTASPI